MESLPVHLFKDSFGPFLALLNEHDLKYTVRQQRSAVPMAASGIIEILFSPYMWGALSTIIVAFLKYRNSRKVIITTKDGHIIQAEGLNQEELEEILKRAKSLSLIETKSDES
jgi:hypothetical protein